MCGQTKNLTNCTWKERNIYIHGMRDSEIDEVMKSLKEKCDASSHLKCGGHALCYGHTCVLDVPCMNYEGPSRWDCERSDSDY